MQLPGLVVQQLHLVAHLHHDRLERAPVDAATENQLGAGVESLDRLPPGVTDGREPPLEADLA
ncbi:MAG: hypothetical protein ACTSU5_17395, partial [Promethearchaeota archaeon]